MHKRARDIFTTIRTEGALLPVDILQRIAEGDRELDGLTPDSYHLAPNERLNEVINRSWTRCLGAWRAFEVAKDALPSSDAGTTLTRERWLLILFQELGYGRLLTAKAQEIDGKAYPISHDWSRIPIHLVSFRQDLDFRTPGVAGAARMSPHSLVQEFLNRSKDHLWGIVSNGLRLRLLRDNASLTRQAFVDFHLEAMMTGEVYSDFVLLYMLAHQSRLEAEKPEECWLETWSQEAQRRGTRALEQLRVGVERAISSLGQGFLAHPANSDLRAKLQSGTLSARGFYEQLLRLVYRFIFLFVAEDRELLLLPHSPAEAKRRYLDHYSLSRVRRLAGRLRGTRHGDLWQGLLVTFECLVGGNPSLGLGPLGGFLFSDQALSDLGICELSNRDLLEAVRHLSFTQEKKILRPVDYRNLGTEELGSVYESLLELHPQVNVNASTFDLKAAVGSERKTTGSYYTPSSLINCLLDSALEPVIAARLERARELASRELASQGRDAYVHHVLSRPHGLAEGHGSGRAVLPPDEDVSSRGALRDGFSNQTVGHVDPGEHRGGLGQGNDEGVSSVPQGGPRQRQGVGDSPPPVSASRAHQSSPDRAGTGACVGDLPHGHFPDWFFAAQAEVGPDSLVPYSLLAEKALLSLKVADPASGSGHFLVAAAHRIAKHLAMIRTGESEPSPEERRRALRDVVSRCIYGVDVNPLAVELCKVALWMETLDPGRPLGFLDHHIKCGNSLIGATPELLEKGIPDDAFKPIEGDDKEVASFIRKRNKQERKGQQRLFAGVEVIPDWQKAVEELLAFGDLPEDAAPQVSEKAAFYETLREKEAFRHERQVADLWTAAFFWPLRKDTLATIPTQDTFRRFRGAKEHLKEEVARRLEKLASQHGFFHWHLEFPEVFSPMGDEPANSDQRIANGPHPAGDSVLPLAISHSPLAAFRSPIATHHSPLSGGFDCVLGNPPWERIKLQEKEFFAQKAPDIANAPNAAARKRLISELRESDSQLWAEFLRAKRDSEGESHFIRASERYPLSAVGDINTYQVFAGLARQLVSRNGRAGIVIPSGIATDDSNKQFFADLTENGALVSLYDFENREKLFPDVDSRMKFCLLTMGGPDIAPDGADFAFFLHRVEHLREEDRHISLTAADIALLNPNTRTCPIFRSRADAELTKAIYRRVPVLIREAQGDRPEENPWGIKFMTMFHMSNDSHLFRTREQLEADGWRLEGNIFRKDGEEYLPLYEAKMIHQFDHRYGSIIGSADVADLSGIPADATSPEQHQDPSYLVLPRYWVPGVEVEHAVGQMGWNRGFLITTRDVARGTDIRTAIQASIPVVGVGHKAPIILPTYSKEGEPALLLSSLNAFALDFVVRQKIGGASLSYFIIKQLPVIHPITFVQAYSWTNEFQACHGWLLLRVLELTYTAWDLEPFAQDCGWSGPPFRWDEERRFILRCELDAAFFHLYLPATANGEWQVANGEVDGEGRPLAARQSLLAAFPTPRDAVSYIMDTFPIVKRKDEQKHGEYRTKRVILEIYDAMQRAMETGEPYQTLLGPPPGPPAAPLPPWNPGGPKPPAWPPHIHPPKRIDVYPDEESHERRDTDSE